MNKFYALLLLSLAVLHVGAQEETEQVKANYQLAARFSPDKLNRMIFSTTVNPHWLKHSERFWYTYETSDGKKWYIVDPVAKRKQPLFDNAKMAAMLTRVVRDPFDAQNIDIRSL